MFLFNILKLKQILQSYQDQGSNNEILNSIHYTQQHINVGNQEEVFYILYSSQRKDILKPNENV